MKFFFIMVLVLFFLKTESMAQVPNYVPSNGLVGWWPFNGNANDESGNGNNGAENGVSLVSDRFGNVNHAFSFDGNDYINCLNSGVLGNASRSVQFWIKSGSTIPGSIFSYGTVDNNPSQDFRCILNSTCNGIACSITGDSKDIVYSAMNTWDHFVFVFDNTLGNSLSALSIYKNSILISNYCNNTNNMSINTSGSLPIVFGRYHWLQYTGNNQYFTGILDDVGCWNRALTQQEIYSLFNACSGNNIITQPTNSIVNVGSLAQFSVVSIVGSLIQWQSNPLDFGWQTVINNANYTGASSNSLTIANASVSNHNQPFRAIVNIGGCIDTSNIATLEVTDTCLTNVMVYDTLLTTVTDTLFINTLTGLPSPNNINTIRVFPNPACDHLTIENGNLVTLAGFSISIINNTGQNVFNNIINQQQFYLDLTSWTGNGLYYIHLVDPNGNMVTERKIVLQ